MSLHPLSPLQHLLAPASVAVIGASARPGSPGAAVWQHLHGFQGSRWAVNPKRPALEGGAVFARIAQLPAAPALAVVCTPARTVAGILGELGARGTRMAVVVSADPGGTHRAAVLDAARRHGLRVLGPDSAGIATPALGLDASTLAARPQAGSLALVSPSTSLLQAAAGWAAARGVGFSHLAGVGEQADIDLGDLLDALANDAATRAIVLHTQQLVAARKWMSAARAAARNKPVIVLKSGRDDAAADAVHDAAIRRAGLLRVHTLSQLFTAAETLPRLAAWRGQGLTLLANGGGLATLAADAAAAHGLAARLHPVPADASPAALAEAARAHLAEPGAGALVVVLSPGTPVPAATLAQAMAPVLAAAPERVLACLPGDDGRARALLADAGLAVCDTPEAALEAFALLRTYHHNQRLLTETPDAAAGPTPDRARAGARFAAAIEQGRERLADDEAQDVLAAYGLPARPAVAIGTRIDPVFGPVVLCGPGGAAGAAALPPLNGPLARELAHRAGHADDDTLPPLLEAAGRLLADQPHLAAMQLTPDQPPRLQVAAEPVAGDRRFAIRPYPGDWARHETWDGRRVCVRPIRPEDEAQHREFLESLGPEDLRMRFFHTRRQLSHGELARLTQIDYDREIAFIAEEDGRTLGTARAIADPDNADAEFALVVRSDLKGRGLGSLLMDRLLDYLKSRGTARVHGLVLHENAAMRGLARAKGFSAVRDDEPGVERWERAL